MGFFFEILLTFSKTYVKYVFSDAGVAQLVERNLAKVEVASSRLVSRSRIQRRKGSYLPPFFFGSPQADYRTSHEEPE